MHMQQSVELLVPISVLPSRPSCAIHLNAASLDTEKA